MMGLYTIKFKSEALQVSKKFKALIVNESGKAIKFFRIDGSEENTSKEFESFLISEVIRHDITSL